MDAPQSPRLDPGRLLARALCVVFGLIGILPLLAASVVELGPMQRWATLQTSRVLKEQLGVDARYRVQIHLIPLRLRIENLEVPATDGAGPALKVESVSVTPRVFSLLAGRLDVGDVEMEAPQARLVLRNGELTNVHYRLPKTSPKKETSKQPPFGSLSITDGRVRVDLDGVELDSGLMDVDVFAERGPAFEVMLSSSLGII
jgi:translocation and assembly module TamB